MRIAATLLMLVWPTQITAGIHQMVPVVTKALLVRS